MQTVGDSSSSRWASNTNNKTVVRSPMASDAVCRSGCGAEHRSSVAGDAASVGRPTAACGPHLSSQNRGGRHDRSTGAAPSYGLPFPNLAQGDPADAAPGVVPNDCDAVSSVAYGTSVCLLVHQMCGICNHSRESGEFVEGASLIGDSSARASSCESVSRRRTLSQPSTVCTTTHRAFHKQYTTGSYPCRFNLKLLVYEK